MEIGKGKERGDTRRGSLLTNSPQVSYSRSLILRLSRRHYSALSFCSRDRYPGVSDLSAACETSSRRYFTDIRVTRSPPLPQGRPEFRRVFVSFSCQDDVERQREFNLLPVNVLNLSLLHYSTEIVIESGTPQSAKYFTRRNMMYLLNLVFLVVLIGSAQSIRSFRHRWAAVSQLKAPPPIASQIVSTPSPLLSANHSMHRSSNATIGILTTDPQNPDNVYLLFVSHDMVI